VELPAPDFQTDRSEPVKRSKPDADEQSDTAAEEEAAQFMHGNDHGLAARQRSRSPKCREPSEKKACQEAQKQDGQKEEDAASINLLLETLSKEIPAEPKEVQASSITVEAAPSSSSG
jgi:hypothetical protein